MVLVILHMMRMESNMYEDDANTPTKRQAASAMRLGQPQPLVELKTCGIIEPATELERQKKDLEPRSAYQDSSKGRPMIDIHFSITRLARGSVASGMSRAGVQLNRPRNPRWHCD